MASSLTLALRTAQSGLLTSQSALDAVAQNVANVNSPGYSRKIVHMEQRVVAGAGAGVELSEVVRAVDEGLLESLRESISTSSQHDVQNSYYARMQDLFGAPSDNISISHIMTEFGSSIEALALAPDQTLEATEFVRQGAEVADKLQSMSDTLQDLREQADSEIAQRVASINSIAENLVNLNNSIIENETARADVTDLKDKRDLALNELAEYVDIKYFYRSDGDVVVFTQNGKTLVDNSAVSVTHNAASNVAPTTTHAEGDFGGIYIGSEITANDITDELRDGELKGLVELRDGVLADMQSQLDEFAAELRDSINLYHNRGSTYPGLTSYNGSRAFLNEGTPATTPAAGEQTITMGNNSDTRITLFDSNGDQHATTTLYTIMNDATMGSGDATNDSGPWSIAEVAATIEDWMQANGPTSATAAIDANTKQFDIDLNSTSYFLSFRDEVNSAGTLPAPSGSTATDATIQFDANGDGTTDETVNGFSNFFGLNDFFVDELADNIHETEIQTKTYSATASTLAIYTGAATTTVTVNAGDNLGNIADTINNLNAGYTATVIPDGSGERLRITSNDGSNFSVNQTAGSFLTDTGMHSADVRVTQNIKVREDLEATPGNVTRSQMQWDSTKGFAGEYYMSKGDGTIVNDMAVMLQTGNAFDAAGGLASTTVSFSIRATSILSYNASLADRNEFNMEYHESLKDSLKLKTDSFSGVNLDEEMSQLILFEQSYSAAARVISVIQSMFDSLDRVIG